MKIKRYQRIQNNKINKKKQPMKNAHKKMQKKINLCNRRITNLVKELHNKLAYYLCTNYDKVLIPEFQTQKIISKKGIGKAKVNETYEKKGEVEGKKELIKYEKKKRLNKRVKYTLGRLSHYRFRQHLINKGNEYGCEIVIVTEEYTSKACTKCGVMSNLYDYREKECVSCGYKINRDIGGPRNILIKNLKDHLQKVDKPRASNVPLNRNVKKIRFQKDKL